MPRGTDTFDKHKVAVEQRRAEAQAQFGPKADYFRLGANQIAAVRFLEQGTEIAWCAMHQIPMEGRQYGQDVVCLDQSDDGTPCPFCQSEHKGIRARSTKGFYNVIWRGGPMWQAANQQITQTNVARLQASQPPLPLWSLGPVFKRNEWGSPEKGPDRQPIILGHADVVFLWKASKTVHEQIVSKDGTYQGLMSRDFSVRRQGSGKDDTVYFIEPVDVNSPGQAMTPEDQQLATQKYNLDEFITPLPYETAAAMLSSVPTNPVAGPQPTFQRGGTPPLPPAPGQLQPATVNTAAESPFQQPAPGTMSQQ